MPGSFGAGNGGEVAPGAGVGAGEVSEGAGAGAGNGADSTGKAGAGAGAGAVGLVTGGAVVPIFGDVASDARVRGSGFCAVLPPPHAESSAVLSRRSNLVEGVEILRIGRSI